MFGGSDIGMVDYEVRQLRLEEKLDGARRITERR
jgi:hypothetical protein